MTIFPQCMACKHLEKGKPMRCAAFPNEIPDPIAFNEVDHRKPYEGDHGIHFEPLPGKYSPFEESEK